MAAEEIASLDPGIAYFPSYEIITGNYNRGSYFAPDLRSVTEEGVNHVMRLFLRHYTDGMAIGGDEPVLTDHERSKALQERIGQAIAVVCEEEVLDRAAASVETG